MSKKIKRNVLIGGPLESGDENNPEYKVMECTYCDRKIVMMRDDWDITINPEGTPKWCLPCIYDLGKLLYPNE
jgi:hypothetical protein